jgi:hypothetical protein
MNKRHKLALFSGTAVAALGTLTISGAAELPSSLASSSAEHATLLTAGAHPAEQAIEHPGELEEPIGVLATAGDGSVTISWAAPSSTQTITGYQLQESLGPEGAWVVVNDQVSGTTDTVSGLLNGTTYEFRVAAEAGSAVGEFSHPLSATPSAVTDAAATATVPGAIARGAVDNSDEAAKTVLEWRAPLSDGGSTITGYEVDLSTDGGASWTQSVALSPRPSWCFPPPMEPPIGSPQSMRSAPERSPS